MCRSSYHTKCFFKFQSINTPRIAIFREAFPDVNAKAILPLALSTFRIQVPFFVSLPFFLPFFLSFILSAFSRPAQQGLLTDAKHFFAQGRARSHS
jgi:hypothetical protein